MNTIIIIMKVIIGIIFLVITAATSLVFIIPELIGEEKEEQL